MPLISPVFKGLEVSLISKVNKEMQITLHQKGALLVFKAMPWVVAGNNCRQKETIHPCTRAILRAQQGPCQGQSRLNASRKPLPGYFHI